MQWCRNDGADMVSDSRVGNSMSKAAIPCRKQRYCASLKQFDRIGSIGLVDFEEDEFNASADWQRFNI